jgi:hypothetical protein
MLAHAGIEFESTTIKSTAKPEDETVDFFFKFKITGDKIVRITDLEVSCGCMEAITPQGEYEPNAKGEVKVTMKVGSIEGESAKYITVSTNDPEHPTIQLDCIIDVPKIYEFSPMTTSWNLGEKPVTKEVKIKILSKDPVNILKYASTRANVTADMVVTVPGREYLLKLTPKSTDEATLGTIKIETDCKIAKYANRLIFFTIVRNRIPEAPAAAAPSK